MCSLDERGPPVLTAPMAEEQTKTAGLRLMSTTSISHVGNTTQTATTEDTATAAALAFAEIFFCMADLAKPFDHDTYLAFRRAGLEMQGDVLTGGGR